jgi:hypothetical protein
MKFSAAGLAFIFPVMLSGCATTATGILDEKNLGGPEIRQVYGNAHREILGLHFVTTFSLTRDGTPAPQEDFVPVYAIGRGDWHATFFAGSSLVAEASAWFSEHDRQMHERFGAMLDTAQLVFPDSRTRTFEIYVFAPHDKIDIAWSQVTANDRGLRLIYANRLPPPGQDDGETVANVALLLLHELSHSYFWFHPEHFVNGYSDEVVAYSLQRCLAVRLFGGSAGDLGSEYEDLVPQIEGLAPGDIYREFHGRYSDSFLANAASADILRRLEKSQSGDMQRYCRTVASSGTDFTRAP